MFGELLLSALSSLASTAGLKCVLILAGTDDWRKLALERLDELNDSLPVAHMVEALLTLLGQSNPAPPIWLKEKAGRMLSSLLMRGGGVAAAMERLVGATQAVSSCSVTNSFVKLFVSDDSENDRALRNHITCYLRITQHVYI